MSWLKFGTDVGDAAPPAASAPSPASPAGAGDLTIAPTLQLGITRDFAKLITLGEKTTGPTTPGQALAPLAILLLLGIGAAAIGGRKLAGNDES